MKDSLSTLPGFFPFGANPVSDADLQPGEVPLLVSSQDFDISVAATEQVIFSNRFGFALRILDAFMVWSEAVDGDASAGDVTAGSAAGGAQFVAAHSFPAAANAVGAVEALTLVTNSLADDAEIFVSHDQYAGVGVFQVFFLLAVPVGLAG